jgi:CDP-diacylglycerol--glycerol-3-phosphate 3-phosphatidyltransferase
LVGEFRKQVDNWVTPVGRSAKRAGISADVVTALGVLMAVACAVSIGLGNLPLGLLFLVLTGVPDLLDGAIAKAAGTAHPRGAFFDSVTDRLTDALIFGGVAWYFTRTSDGALPMLAFAVFASASMVSYIRAKADSLGFDAHVGLIERAERFVVLGFGLLFGGLLVWTLWVLLAFNLLTASQRFVAVWRQASANKPRPVRPTRRRRSVGETSAAERWRSRRIEARERGSARRRPPR